MPQTQHQQRASGAVVAWLARHERNHTWLAEETGLDPGTVGTFLAGKTWPKVGNQGKFEKALGWPSGTIHQIARSGVVPEGLLDTAASVGGLGHDADQFVESLTGERVQSGVTNEDLLREILRSRAEQDRIAGRVEAVETDIRSLSERVARLEQ